MERKISVLGASFLLVGVGFGGGWFSHQNVNKEKEESASVIPLRLGGYKYINPLLAYDIGQEEDSSKFKNLKHDLEEVIELSKARKEISDASVYFRSVTTGEAMSVNPSIKYEPASLNKIPLMMTLYRMAEDDPNLLSKKITIPSDLRANVGIEIQPKDILQPGQTYTVEEAITKLITDSDNNAYEVLIREAKFDIFSQSFKDLHIPLQTISEGTDFLTAQDFSYFLRVLYNATYLSREYSEKAMEVLSNSKFNDGLAAGLPSTILIADKFGIATSYATDRTTIASRELHDCGFIYHPERPYIICVMTKGSSTLENSKSIIKKISQTVFQSVERNYK